MNGDISTSALVLIMVAAFITACIVSAVVTHRIRKKRSANDDIPSDGGSSNGRSPLS